MCRAWILGLTAGLFAAGLGCSKTCQHTAGVCDCCPPPVESVLTPYANMAAPPPPVPAFVPAHPIMQPTAAIVQPTAEPVPPGTPPRAEPGR